MKAIKRVNVELSDLFFNYSHETYEALFGKSKEGPTWDEMSDAILEDAKEFCSSYPTFTDGYSADDLANDFMGRL